MHDEKSKSTLEDALRSNASLAFYKALAVVPTQPIQNAMRMQQQSLKDPKTLSFLEAVREIRRTSKIRFGIPIAFENGAMGAVTKETVKAITYKGVVITRAPHYASDTLGKWFPVLASSPALAQHSAVTLCAAGAAATADGLIGGPLDRFVTYRTTSHGKKATASFSADFKKAATWQKKVGFMYQGLGATLVKCFTAYVPFYGTAKPIQQSVNAAFEVPEGGKTPWQATALSAFISGTVVALFSAPFDAIKTMKQMPGAEQASLLTLLQNSAQNHGRGVWTVGLGAKIFQIVIGWGITHAVTQREEHASYKRSLYRIFPTPTPAEGSKSDCMLATASSTITGPRGR